ncbi:MAG: hypothetical protein EAZ64_08060 [Sphingobacteriales bacterium]|nr:MAG: hypothetical protein EAZ64_08060 [Sphingobacteriales bacterium]
MARWFKKIAYNQSIEAFVQGITAAVVSTLLGSTIVITMRTIADITTAIIALFAVLVLVNV